jgi:hypothetical protein
MTNEELTVEIAEFCGWRNIREQDYQSFGTDPYIDGPSQVWVGIHPESDVDSKEYEVIPDYCNDLNEMHEAEKMLNEKQEDIMNSTLWDIMDGRKYLWHSTASQQAEAFVRTIDKWKG